MSVQSVNRFYIEKTIIENIADFFYGGSEKYEFKHWYLLQPRKGIIYFSNPSAKCDVNKIMPFGCKTC